MCKPINYPNKSRNDFVVVGRVVVVARLVLVVGLMVGSYNGKDGCARDGGARAGHPSEHTHLRHAGKLAPGR